MSFNFARIFQLLLLQKMSFDLLVCVIHSQANKTCLGTQDILKYPMSFFEVASISQETDS
jgi:hypothetical protein